ncbi:MAG: hypothetical protein C4318_00355 [Acidimicrobiia bacterium]
MVRARRSKYSNLAAALLATAVYEPDRPALLDFSQKLTFGDLLTIVSRVSRSLERAGLQPSDHVGIALDGIDFVEAYLAVLCLGAVAVPLNLRSPAFEVAKILRETQTHVLVCGSKLGPHGALDSSTIRETALGEVEWLYYDELRGDVCRASTKDFSTDADAPATEAEQTLSFFYEPKSEDPAVLIMTGGTSGEPRAAILTHRSMLANLYQLDSHPGTKALPGDVSFGVLPLYHIFGLNVAVGSALFSGCAVAFPQTREEDWGGSESAGTQGGPELWAEAIRELGVTVVAGSPNMWRAIVEANTPPQVFSSVRICTSGAAPLSRELFEEFRSKYGQFLWEGYGMTEASPVITSSRLMDEPIAGCVGLPLPGIRLEIRDEDGHPVEADDHGEVWIAGDNVFSGYWGHPEETAEALVEGWLRTGDVGVVGERGELYLVDRLKDVVIVGGFNVYPFEIESVIKSHPAISDAVVVGEKVHDDERLVAYVVASEPEDTSSANLKEDIRQYLATKVSRYKIPKDIRIVDEIPRTALAKVPRASLKRRPR